MNRKKEPTQEELRDFVNREVMVNQSMLVEELLKNSLVSYDDLVNFTKSDKELKDEGYTTKEEREKLRNNGEDTHEIYEWWLVSEWLLTELEKCGQPILQTDWGCWWGRTCTGQAIKLDGVIEDIYKRRIA